MIYYAYNSGSDKVNRKLNEDAQWVGRPEDGMKSGSRDVSLSGPVQGSARDPHPTLFHDPKPVW